MSEREPYIWSIAIVVAWLVVILVIVASADGADPTVEAGTVVMLLPLAAFGAAGIAGLRGRERHWTTRAGVTMGVLVATAYLVTITVRGEFGAVYLVPLIAFVGGAVLWLCSGAGWLIGTVVRYGLGIGGADDEDEGFL